MRSPRLRGRPIQMVALALGFVLLVPAIALAHQALRFSEPGDGSALYLAEVRSHGSFRDREIDSSGVETAFLVETPEGWRIRHIHWSSR